MLFGKHLLVLWPKSNTTEFYSDQKENNLLSFDFNLWSKLNPADITALTTYFRSHISDQLTVLVPDDVVFTKSFIYDTQINNIEKNEVIGLAESFVRFKIQPDLLEYELIQANQKTIIQARLYDPTKINHLKANLSQLPIKNYTLTPVSAALTRIFGTSETGEYFLLYPLNHQEHTLILAQKNSVFLTSNHKSTALEIQKIINYSNLYFSSPTTKFFLPPSPSLDIISTTNLEKIPYDEAKIAISLKKPSNLPLPVLAVLYHNAPTTAIMDTVDTSSNPQTTMENKKNILPLIAVFVVTAAFASVIIWFVMNRSDNGIQNPSSDNNPTPTSVIEIPPTDTPIPTLAEISKKIKIQVLNSTDINGQAAALKDKISKLGFTSVIVGNSSTKVLENQIRVKAGQNSTGNYFVSSLAGYFDAVVVADLVAASSYDVVMNIGVKLGTDLTVETSAPPASPSAKPTVKPTVKPTTKPTTSTSITPTLEP